MSRISLQTIHHIDVRHILTNSHDGDDTLTGRITLTVHTNERVTLLESCIRRETFYLRDEVIELEPVEAVNTICQGSDTHLSDAELISLDDLPVVRHVRSAIELLHLYEVTLTEYII